MSNRVAFAVLAVACLCAAAGGGFLATRQNAIPVPASAQSAPAAMQPSAAAVPTTTTAASQATEKPVQETEAVVERASKSSPSAPVSKSSPSAPGVKVSQNPKSARPAQNSQGTLASSWPSSAGQQAPPTPPVAPAPPEIQAPRAEDRAVQEPPRAPEPPRPTFEELVISRDSVIGMQTENRISTDTAHVEDKVEARVTRDVRVGDRIAIPSGARVLGTVTQVERGGKFKEQAKLGIRFNTIVLGDGTRLPISTETIMRLGEAPGNKAAQKVGGAAVGGAILGAILGGSKGAAIGATAGAGGGAAVVQAGDQSTVVLQPGTPLTARILSPVTVTVEKD
jgi:hypothetical protein